ncbi:MAG TPA: hypothetical protein VGN75_03785 [Kaistia sp.]|nr:hypothetical protein [Kaistia sp.]
MKAADFKTIALCAAGVIVAGLILSYGRDIDILNQAHDGFDYTG